MQLIRGLQYFKASAQGYVATIGNFDGVHLGHQAILKQLLAAAEQHGCKALVITFDPQPREFFSDDCPARLTRLREKLFYLERFGIETVLCLQFNQALAAMPASAFISDILLKKCHIKHLIVGDDFRFGHKRQGDYALLQSAGKQFGFGVTEAATVMDDNGERISSTRIRSALAKGEISLAGKLLGHSYGMLGRVAHGDKIGRTLGFPTANIHLHRKRTPLSGIFAVKVHGLEKTPVLGAANVGTRPAVGGTRCLLEVHLLNFNREIYGESVQVEFCHKIRDEENYDSLEKLKAQIAIDVKNIEEYFRQ